MKTTVVSLLLVAAPLSTLSGNAAAEAYVAHEWGTFTSVQGADGGLVEWSPIETTQLPRFVHDWGKPGLERRPAGALNPGLKGRFITLQRMETPVIYFYSEKEQTVDVTVRFPQGLITEWYPQAHDIGPSAFPPNRLAHALDGLMDQAGLHAGITFASMFGRKGTPDSRIAWHQVRVLPPSPGGETAHRIPTDSSGSHYFAARETDAALVQVRSSDPSAGATEHERFLFYRGVGNFKTPLQVTFSSGNETNVFLRNTGLEELRHLFVLTVHHRKGKFIYESHVSPGQYVTVELPPEPDLLQPEDLATHLSDRMIRALVDEGLYEREARAMVKTWRESWFEEDGLRVLYLLPRAWTDDVLPLTLDPKPRQLVRAMVGRAEIITPGTEWELLRQIVRFADGDPAVRQQAIEDVRQLGLGRFVEPALRRVLGTHPSREFSRVGWELMNASTGRRKTDESITRR